MKQSTGVMLTPLAQLLANQRARSGSCQTLTFEWLTRGYF